MLFFSKAVFESLGHHLDEGRVPVVWWYCDEGVPAQLAIGWTTWVTIGVAVGFVLISAGLIFWAVKRRKAAKVGGLSRSKSCPGDLAAGGNPEAKDKELRIETSIVVVPTTSELTTTPRPTLYSLGDDAWKASEESLKLGPGFD